MDDDIRELLMLAAKACGYTDSNPMHGYGSIFIRNEYGEPLWWNPATNPDDGALMEARLGIFVTWYGVEDVQCCVADGPVAIELFSDHNGDKQAARMMASLRVAAEIGRSKT